MKKIYYLSILFAFILLFSVHSCKKDSKTVETGNPLSATSAFARLNEQAKIQPLEVSRWLQNLPEAFRADVQLNKAEQNVINGRQVIRVPIGKDAALYFTREPEGGELKVWAYKELDEHPKEKNYTGKIVAYSFQDGGLTGMRYVNGKMVKYGYMAGTKPVFKTTTLDNKKVLNVGNEISSLGSIWCWLTGGFWDGPVEGCNYNPATDDGIVGAIKAFFETLFGAGTGDDSSNSSAPNYYVSSTPYYGSSPSSGGSPGVPAGGWGSSTPSYGGGAVWAIHYVYDGDGNGPSTDPGPDGPTGGGGSGLPPRGNIANGHWENVQITDAMLTVNLINTLVITDNSKQEFLYNNPAIAFELYNYLQQQGDTQDNRAIAKDYIDNLIGDANYLSFVKGHSNTGSTGIVWWQDNSWLENVNNFSLNFDSELYDIYQRLNPQEKVILALYPYQGYLISKNKPIAENEAITRHPSSTALNDKTDAFRHAFFNAMNERDCGTSMFGLGGSIAKLYSDAHESNTPPDLNIEKQMDIHNNTVGQSLLHQSPALSSTDNSSLSNAVETALLNGQLVYLSPLNLSLPRGIIVGTTHITPTNQ